MRYNGPSEFQGSFVWIYYGQECNVRNEIRFWLRDDLREMLPQNKEQEDDQEKDTKRRGSSVRVLIPEEKQEREEKRSGHKKNKRGVSQRQRSSSWSHEHEIWGKEKERERDQFKRSQCMKKPSRRRRRRRRRRRKLLVTEEKRKEGHSNKKERKTNRQKLNHLFLSNIVCLCCVDRLDEKGRKNTDGMRADRTGERKRKMKFRVELVILLELTFLFP